MRFGLVGRRLSHSWSPAIHAALGSAPYELVELEPPELEGFLRRGAWEGLNVTIPYKRAAFELSDVQSASARRLGVANTLTKDGQGRIIADNTDLAGFSWMLERFCRERLGRPAERVLGGGKVCVLGSGGASQAVRAALEDAGAEVVVISRGGPCGYESLSGGNSDSVLIVNATPVGMYPDCPQSPLTKSQLQSMPLLSGVLDVVYNPTRTGMCLDAEELGIPSMSGLPMLVAQAALSSSQFLGSEFREEGVVGLCERLLSQSLNIILIGMPGAGKTSTGRSLARQLMRPFVDLDDAISLEAGMPAARYLESVGEDGFRRLESKVALRYGSQSNLIIACGGGVVVREENYRPLRQNGRIVLLERPLDRLSLKGRPLSRSRGVEALARERMPLYERWSDLRVHCTGSPAGDARKIRELLGL